MCFIIYDNLTSGSEQHEVLLLFGVFIRKEYFRLVIK